METTMNKWQEQYVKEYGKPHSKKSKQEFDMLGKMKTVVSVDFPEFNGKPAHKEVYTITIDECDMPHKKISVRALASNLTLWVSRGYKVYTA